MTLGALIAGLLLQAAAAPPVPIVVGETRQVDSRYLGDRRPINVYLPPGYAGSEDRYPILYLIDGGLEQDFLHVAGTSHLGALWARSRALIVVGIETRDRRRELVGPTSDPALLARYPTAGESAAFRDFLRDEVKPMIERNYRASGEDGVIGESLAGLFIVETYLREPGLFDHYAAISPSLWWDQARLSQEAAALLARGPAATGRLYLALADEGAESEVAVDRLVDALEARPGQRPPWCFVTRPDLTHATIYHSVSPQALQYLFPTEAAPDPASGFTLSCARSAP